MADAEDRRSEREPDDVDVAADGREDPKELRCTFCGLTACWTADAEDESAGEERDSAR